MTKKLISILMLFCSLAMTACANSKEEILKANSFIEKQDYGSAIEVLSKLSSKSSKELLSKTHLDYGIAIIRDKKSEKSELYSKAKSQFEAALKLDPKNKTARDLYQMVVKLEVLYSNKTTS